jgi:transposase
MHRYELTDEQWARIADYFPANGRRGGQWKDHRRAVNGVLWVLCSGAPWRDLPGRYGSFQTAHRRHLLWRRDGTWERVLAGLRAEADERGLIDWARWNADSTSVRATRHAAGARKKGGPSPASRRTTAWASPAAASAASCTC